MPPNPVPAKVCVLTRVTVIPVVNLLMVPLFMDLAMVTAVKLFITKGTFDWAKFKMMVHMFRQVKISTAAPRAEETVQQVIVMQTVMHFQMPNKLKSAITISPVAVEVCTLQF